MFEDRLCYRLLAVSVAPRRVDLGFGSGRYFDVINTCEPVAHELADARRLTPAATPPDVPFRTLIGDPCDLSRRPVMVAISALTLRRSPAGTTFVLHEEFLGDPEHDATDGPLDYARGPFFRRLAGARRQGRITAHYLGLGVDPLSLVTDLLVAVVFDADSYDALFADTVAVNAEGDVTGNHPSTPTRSARSSPHPRCKPPAPQP